MKRTHIRSLISFLVLVGGAAVSPAWTGANGEMPAAAIPQQQGGATISGKVNDSSNVALPGAAVTVKNDAGEIQNATTDKKGSYKITGLAAGTYTITVTAKGFKKFEVSGIPLNANDSVPLDVALEQGESEPAAAQPASAAPQEQTTAPPANPLDAILSINPQIPPPPPGAGTIVAKQTIEIPKDANHATVTGTVTDQTGAAISNATVEISNAKGFKKTVTTNIQGIYVVSGLDPGSYDVSVSAPNFKAFQTSSMTLAAGATIPLDASLEPAGEKTEINVQAGGAAQVETENAEVSGTITQKETTNLMLNGRNFSQLITLTAGVSNQTGQDEAKVGVVGSVKYSVNGGRVEYNSFEVDGSDVLNAGLSGAESTLVVYPSLDSIQEVKVLTSNYGAQYGRTASGTVQVTTKSGTPSYHGNLYEFFRNEAMNARNYFDQTTSAPFYRRNDFGGTFGGPIWIPGHYNQKKDKTFFFFSEEARIEKSPSELQSNFNFAVPTLAERQGDFSDVCPSPNIPADAKYLGENTTFPVSLFPDCPGVPYYGGPGRRQGFIEVNQDTGAKTYNNLVLSQLALGGQYPKSGMDPVALALLSTNLIPLPNAFAGCNSSLVGKTDPETGEPIKVCYDAVISEPTHWREELFRLDHHFTSKLQLTFRYIHDSWNTVSPTPVWGTVKNTFPTVQNQFVGPGIDTMVRLTQTPTPTLVNETVFSFTNSHITLSNVPGPGVVSLARPSGLGNPTQVGTCTGGANSVAECPMGYLFNNGFGNKPPGVVITGNNQEYGGNGFTVDPSYMPWEHTNPTFNVRDDLSKVWGRHTVQFGVQVVRAQKNETNGALGAASGDVQGLLTFSNVNGGASNTGNAFANLLYNVGDPFVLGGSDAIRSFTQDSAQLRYYNRYWIAEPFVQDDWKITPRVTINAGVRFSLFGNYHERYLRAYNWDPKAWNPILASQLKVDPVTGELVGLPENKPIPLNLSNLDPRITNGLVQCGHNGVPDSCVNRYVFNPAPRVGFAWDLKGDGKTSIRGGYGIFFEHGTGDEANTGSLEGSAPLVLNVTQPFPAGFACIGDYASDCDASGNGLTTAPGAYPLNVTSLPANTRYSYSQQWSLGVQRALPISMLASFAYVGSKGTRLTVERQLNQLQPVPAADNPFSLHEPILLTSYGSFSTFADCDNQGGLGNPPKFILQNGATVTSTNPASINLQVACQGESSNAQAYPLIPVPNTFRPYPGIGEIFSLQNGADSAYHAFQATIRRTKGPLTAGVAYTFSHSIDDSSDRTDPTFVNSLDLRSNKASSNFDQRHLLNISYVYELPKLSNLLQDALVGISDKPGDEHRGDPAGASPATNTADASAGGLVRFLGDGWQFSGITTYQSGTPFSVINNAGASGIGVLDNAGVANGVGAGSFPDIATNAPPPAFRTNPSSFGPLLGNPNEFVAPRGLTFGNAGRNFLNNPSRLNFDMSLLKHFAIREGSDLEFRAEAFNIFNHTQFRIYDPNFGNTGSNTVSCYGGPNYSAGAYFPGGVDCLTGNAFLHPVDAHRPRTLQLALKLSF